MKRAPMVRGRGSRTKGGAAERELTHLLRDIGFSYAQRNFRSGADGAGDIIGVPDHSIECKRQERLCIWAWLAQAEAAARPTETAVVAFRRNKSPWYAVVRAEDYFAMVKELQELRGA